MRYVLKKRVLAQAPSLEYTETEYRAAKAAKSRLDECLEIEEKFDLLLENYREYEETLLGIVLRNSTSPIFDWSDGNGILHTVNRRLTNFLTACRLYLDQVPHNLGEIYPGDTSAKDRFEKATHREYDARLGYRVMSGIRNYIQHRGLPVHRLMTSMHRIQETGQTEHFVTPLLNVAELRNDKKFSKLAKQFSTDVESADLTPMVREYMSGISAIHAGVRDTLSVDINNWDTTIHELIASYTVKHGSDVLGLAFSILDGRRLAVEWFSVCDDPIKRRACLALRNMAPVRYEKALITGRSKAP